ncbi:hypothetical protein N665_2583s0003 [Sinapis alba]|nr:hypothetical protein N665_2583s0003 [Sinapis alba]
MAEALLSFGVEKLWNLIVRESERSKGFDEQFKVLKRDVEKLRWFLEDADAKKHTSATVRNTIKEIKEIVFDAEDIIETFLLKQELGNTSGIRNIVRRFSCVSLERRGLALDIEALSTRISKEIQAMQSFGVQQRTVSESRMPPQDERRRTFPSVNEEDPLVGMEKNVETLVGYLVEEDSSQVISITGMGGLGKTTLARQVYNHEAIKGHFPRLAWVCVSQQFERKCVWQTILQKLRPEIKVLEMTEHVLQETLAGVLETQKALIIIDDIWREGDWDLIKPVFLRGKGWKILLTTRNEGVALHANKQCLIFKPKCLTFEESWDLFKRIAFPTSEPTEVEVDEGMEKMGKEMIKHCGGLPLAVKLLGGLLGDHYALHEWERIYGNLKAHIVRGASFEDRNINSVYDVLYLSYEELPAYLKHCFLYLAHFPEDYPIDVEDLSYYWAAEGMPRPRNYDGASIQDVADGYIAELVKRNMVISERDIRTSKFETCQLHDMMREVCLRKAEEESSVQIIGAPTASSKSPCKSRRLAVVRWSGETFNVETEVTNASLRTLLFIGSIYRWKATTLFFKRHKLMRVLDLSHVEFEGGKVPSSIGRLIHLRYLSLKDAIANHLPYSMRNLKQLLYLNLHVRKYGIYMPNILKEMRELAYLYLPKGLHDKVKMELGNLVKLEILENFSTDHGNVRDLQDMTRLRTLSIKNFGGQGYTREALSSSLIKLRCLENLTIIDYKNPMDDDEVGFSLSSIHLRYLNLQIYMPMLPDKRHFPSHLTSIYLAQCRLKEDPMPIFEKLLHLKQVTLGVEAFRGKIMVCSRGGFPQLEKLKLWKLEELEEWRVEDGSMPILHSLSIWNCDKFEEWTVEQGSMPLLHSLEIYDCIKLKELHDSLQFITSVKDLSVSFNDIQCMRLSEEQLPSHLTFISLFKCHLEEDPMPILEKLLHLEYISLKKISFCGNRMVCSSGGFPQLKELKLWKLEELEEWIVEDGSMPILHSLIILSCDKFEKWKVEQGSMPLLHSLEINDCQKLKELRDSLQFITSVKDLSVSFNDIQCMRLSEEPLPSHLTSISLCECHLEEDPMPILEKLLHLKNIFLRELSFCGSRMVCSRGGFPKLQKLEITRLKELDEWIVEEGSMPLLHTLKVDSCPKLKEIPDGLQFITSLEYLSVRFMREEWKKRLSEGGEDYYKVQHIPCVKFYQ